MDEYDYDGRKVLHVYVPTGKTVYRNAGRIYDRSNESDVDITDNADMVFNLYARKQNTYFVNKVYPNIPVSSLRHDLIDRARMMTRANTNSHPWLNMSDEEMLRSCGLILEDPDTREEGVTLAAILLFGTDSVIMSVLPQHKTDAICRVYNVDRYDDRDVVITNLLESYDRLMAFGQKHLNDIFTLDGIQRVSSRDKILREIISNLLMHRDFSSGYIPKFVIEKDKLVTENANQAHGHGILSLNTFKPFSKNPPIARVFREIGLADELGSGMRNTYKYSLLYAGTEPIFTEGDVFTIVIPLSNAATMIKVGPTSNESSKDTGGTISENRGHKSGRDAIEFLTENEIRKLLEFCKTPKGRAEMQSFCNKGMSDELFRRKVVRPLLSAGLLKPTIPEKPKSKNQKYTSLLG